MENMHGALAPHAQSSLAQAIKSEDSASEEGEILERKRSDNPTCEHSHSIHDARRRLMESDEPMEVDHEVCQRWEPTGANKQPIGIKSESPGAESYRNVRGFPSLRRIETPAPFPQLLETQPHLGLMYPIERYLPPAGIYYDQFALPTVFGALFFSRECCKICWKAHVGAGGSAPLCGKKCQVCRTDRHRDESCPLLYCSAHWYHAHNIPYLPETLRSRQMRPNDQELAILCNMGVLRETRGPNGTIMAQPDHPIVQAFYDSRPTPQAMTGKIVDTERKPRSAFITTAEGSSFVPNVQSQQPLPPPRRQHSFPRTTVINSLDPRLQGRGTTEDTEDKLQEQEIEILKLRMDVIVKTREIRKLNAENDALKVENGTLRMRPVNTSVSFETGDNKPPWL